MCSPRWPTPCASATPTATTFGTLGLLDRTPPNLLWFVVVDERARIAFDDWDEVADEQVASLHRLRRGDAATDAFAAQLGEVAGSAFTDRWRRRPLQRDRSRVTLLTHPAVGSLRLTVETLRLTDEDHRRLVVHLPADAATAIGLDRLAGRSPGVLRSVTG